MMRRLLTRVLRRFVRQGRFEVRWPDGELTAFVGVLPGPVARLVIRDRRSARALLLSPIMALGEGFMDGGLVPEGCDIDAVIDVLGSNMAAHPGANPFLALRSRLGRLRRRLDQWNPPARARRHASHHYDLGDDIYALFLDTDWQYSCAYFPRGDETLDEAQAAKRRHIAAKLLLRPGLRVLDIGCGWGGLALHLAREHGVAVHGVTLSREQLVRARARAGAAGLADRVTFDLADYRAITGRFDRIVSVGMFEHVGINHYAAFFAVLRRLLAEDGIALLHAIGRGHGPGATNPWVTKYIFPGGYVPALSEVFPPLERSGLLATDVEILRLHYARTLRLWRERFLARRTEAVALRGERFARMWEFYLAQAEVGFLRLGFMVSQIQIACRVDTAPITRDYMRDYVMT